MTDTAHALELKQIRKAYGAVQVIHGVDLEIPEGEFVVFVGPSGCGKSTLLRLIAGLDDPSSGDILLKGQRVNAVPASERGLSMVFQSYALYPHMSVRQNLSFGLENIRMPKDEIARRVDAAAKLLQIDQLLGRRPGQLSGGQRQRVAIGRAIVREPVIFLFDEPLSNLDAELRLQMRVEISQLHDQLGNTMIYVTHDQVEAMTMADRIVVLRGGRIEQVGRPLDLYNTPANKFVAGFIGAPQMNFLKGELDGRVLRLESGLSREVPVAEAGRMPVTLGVRPEAIGVSLEGEGDAQVSVRNFEQLGSVTYIYTAFPNGETLTVQLPRQIPLRRGQTIGITFDPAAFHLSAGRASARCPWRHEGCAHRAWHGVADLRRCLSPLAEGHAGRRDRVPARLRGRLARGPSGPRGGGDDGRGDRG
jgi:ABC-type sugar transport system ATPase subunit